MTHFGKRGIRTSVHGVQEPSCTPGSEPCLRTPHPCPQSSGPEHVSSNKRPQSHLGTPPVAGPGQVSEAGSESWTLPPAPTQAPHRRAVPSQEGVCAADLLPLAHPANQTYLSRPPPPPRALHWEWPGNKGTGCPPLQVYHSHP